MRTATKALSGENAIASGMDPRSTEGATGSRRAPVGRRVIVCGPCTAPVAPTPEAGARHAAAAAAQRTIAARRATRRVYVNRSFRSERLHGISACGAPRRYPAREHRDQNKNQRHDDERDRIARRDAIQQGSYEMRHETKEHKPCRHARESQG